MDYLLIKWVHILSSTILFGTGIGSAFFMFVVNRKRDVAVIAAVTRYVVIADWLFTSPAVVVQLVTGGLLMHEAGYALHEGWIQWGVGLYVFVGMCWLPVVWIQIQMRDMARAALETSTPLPARYWQLDRWWIILGSLAFPAVVVIFYVMVVKP
jgi:uncharacterized membrane protein